MIAQTFRRIQQVTFKSKRLAARPLMTEERNSYIVATTGKLIRSYEHSRHYNFYTHIFLYYLLSRGDTSPPPSFLLPSPLPPDGSACIHEHTGVAQHSGGGFQSPAPVDCSTTTSSTSGSDRTSARILIAQFFSSFEQFNLEVSPKRVP